jgi:group I intron endonuclease
MSETENNGWNITGEMLNQNGKKPENDTMKIKGIYKICNKINGKYYIGSSINIKDSPNSRWSRHVADLNKNRHHNDHLQRAWNKYGKDNFEFSIIQHYNGNLDEELLMLEQRYLNIAKKEKDNCYNECYIAGKVTMTPEIRKKIGAAHKGKIGLRGKNNPMYGKKLSNETKKKISDALSGENNPFYGRKHSPDTIKKFRNAAKRGTDNYNYDKTVYNFLNIKTNESFTGTRHQLYTKYNLDRRSVKRLIKGQRNMYNGWKLIK